MIELFNIVPHKVDTSKFSNLLHDSVVHDFEAAFAEYVGAKYACSTNSETSAILTILYRQQTTVTVPSIIPHVVLNAILLGGNNIRFSDNVVWVGDSYVLHRFSDCKLIDSAQKVSRNQFKTEADDADIMLFSFYPTKPIGSCDGGMVVSNDKNKIDELRISIMNGTTFNENNWEREIISPGWKMYMNSIQAQIAFSNLQTLDMKKERLAEVRCRYNKELGYDNTSDHLYRIVVHDGDKFRAKMKKEGIVCGKHYTAMHQHPIYANGQECPQSELVDKTTASIPFHEALSDTDIDHVIASTKKYV